MMVHDVREFGAAIREERKRQHLTQTELADLSGTSLSFISGLENGKRSAEIGKAFVVMQTLGIDMLCRKRA